MDIILIQKLSTRQGEPLNEKILGAYKGNVVPTIGDAVFVTEDIVGEVEKRCFSKNEPNRVVLILKMD